MFIIKAQVEYANRLPRTMNTYPETGKNGCLVLQILGPCCLTNDDDEALVTSSTTLGSRAEGEEIARAYADPRMTTCGGVTGPSSVFHPTGDR
jgi:hypothetical protein